MIPYALGRKHVGFRGKGALAIPKSFLPLQDRFVAKKTVQHYFLQSSYNLYNSLVYYKIHNQCDFPG